MPNQILHANHINKEVQYVTILLYRSNQNMLLLPRIIHLIRCMVQKHSKPLENCFQHACQPNSPTSHYPVWSRLSCYSRMRDIVIFLFSWTRSPPWELKGGHQGSENQSGYYWEWEIKIHSFLAIWIHVGFGSGVWATYTYFKMANEWNYYQ